jgi:DNA-binding transcriptional MerR regulator
MECSPASLDSAISTRVNRALRDLGLPVGEAADIIHVGRSTLVKKLLQERGGATKPKPRSASPAAAPAPATNADDWQTMYQAAADRADELQARVKELEARIEGLMATDIFPSLDTVQDSIVLLAFLDERGLRPEADAFLAGAAYQREKSA